MQPIHTPDTTIRRKFIRSFLIISLLREPPAAECTTSSSLKLLFNNSSQGYEFVPNALTGDKPFILLTAGHRPACGVRFARERPERPQTECVPLLMRSGDTPLRSLY